MAEELDYGRVERLSVDRPQEPKGQMAGGTAAKPQKKQSLLNLVILACIVCLFFDVPGFFLNEIPLVGVVITVLADMFIFVWYFLSGIPIKGRTLWSVCVTSVLESIPFIGNSPIFTGVVIVNYLSQRFDGN